MRIYKTLLAVGCGITMGLICLQLSLHGQQAGGIPTTAPASQPQPADRVPLRIMSNYDQAVAHLIAQVEKIPPDASGISDTKQDTWLAIYALGHLRATSAIPVLLDRIHLQDPLALVGVFERQKGPYDVPSRCGVEATLVKIGVPALAPTLKHFAKTREGPLPHLRVIIGALDSKDLADAWLASAEKSKDAAERAAATELKQLLNSPEKALELQPKIDLLQ